MRTDKYCFSLCAGNLLAAGSSRPTGSPLFFFKENERIWWFRSAVFCHAPLYAPPSMLDALSLVAGHETRRVQCFKPALVSSRVVLDTADMADLMTRSLPRFAHCSAQSMARFYAIIDLLRQISKMQRASQLVSPEEYPYAIAIDIGGSSAGRFTFCYQPDSPRYEVQGLNWPEQAVTVLPASATPASSSGCVNSKLLTALEDLSSAAAAAKSLAAEVARPVLPLNKWRALKTALAVADAECKKARSSDSVWPATYAVLAATEAAYEHLATAEPYEVEM